MKKIICIGNRFLHPDGIALWIYDKAIQKENQNVQWIEGGIGGMNLLPHFQTDQSILILDYFTNETNAQIFSLKEILQKINITEYSHPNAFYYLLRSLDILVDKQPKIDILSCNPQSVNYENEIFTSVNEWVKDAN